MTGSPYAQDMSERMPPALSEPPSQGNDLLPPPLSPALARRVKRHVVGAEQAFFAIVSPGIESICAEELAALGIGKAHMHLVAGGVEFTGRLRDAYLIHLHSRLSTRILMRIAEFKATGFAALEKKTAEVPWELFIYPGFPVEIKVTTKHSRLIHSTAIAERIKWGISERFGPLQQDRIHPVFCQRVFVRALKDRFTLSLDATGEPLYMRGLKRHGGRAPLRETAAAAILRLAGYRPDRPLIDPMSGTGTFAIEAALIARNIAPGWFRTFAFMGWPSFKPQQWTHLRREAHALFTDGETAPIVASDLHPEACRRLADCLEAHDLSKTVQVMNRDFFDVTPASVFGTGANIPPGLIVINPPYGKRLGSEKQSATPGTCKKPTFRRLCKKAADKARKS
jgi:putative N6-adenine-specific DNA methylase